MAEIADQRDVTFSIFAVNINIGIIYSDICQSEMTENQQSLMSAAWIQNTECFEMAFPDEIHLLSKYMYTEEL